MEPLTGGGEKVAAIGRESEALTEMIILRPLVAAARSEL